MTERELIRFWNKRVRLKTTTGRVIIGFCESFTRAIDNEPEEASLDIKTDVSLIEVYASEVQSIEIVDKS